MAGRGRGRGRANLSFNVEELGFGRGEALPTAVLQPPPLFPPLLMKPSPLTTGEKYDYLVALKQEYRNTAIESPFYVKVDNKRRDVQRYSDKYQVSANVDCDIQFTPDYGTMPAELRPKSAAPNTKPKLASKPCIKDVESALNRLEAKETLKETEADEDDEDKEEEGVNQEEEVYDEEDEEEETDYLMSHFDNGEGFMDEEDDNLDEPTY